MSLSYIYNKFEHEFENFENNMEKATIDFLMKRNEEGEKKIRNSILELKNAAKAMERELRKLTNELKVKVNENKLITASIILNDDRMPSTSTPKEEIDYH